jgi:hypothetical protein
MGILGSRKPQASPRDEGGPDPSPPVLHAYDGARRDDAAAETPDTSNREISWVRVGDEALWVGVLADDAFETAPDAEEKPAASDVAPLPAPAVSQPDPPNDADGLDAAATLAQQPGSLEFRVLCGARAPEDIRRRFSWKTDQELAESYEIAVNEHSRAERSGQEREARFWDALVRTAVQEAVSRPAFGELDEWDAPDDRREQRLIEKQLDALARVREQALRDQG